MEELIKKIRGIDWEFRDKDTQYLTHNIHRYSGKFIPQIAKTAIKLLTKEGDTVLDPYVGSGTTALECILTGRKNIGVDLNPLAVLIARVKTLRLPKAELEQFEEDFIGSVTAVCKGQTSIFPQKYKGNIKDVTQSVRYHDEWNKKWYQNDVLKQLIQIYDIIESVENEQLRSIAIVSFSDILRKSSNASSRYPNVMYDKNHKKKSLPLDNFIDTFSCVINQLKELSIVIEGNNINNKITLGNNTSLTLEPQSVDAIITHPPYIAAIPYAEYGSLSLEWLGYSSKELDEKLTGGKRHRKDVVDRFVTDYTKMMEESYRVLKKGHFAFFMVGNPTSHGEKIPLDILTKNIAEEAGFKHLVTVTRNGVNRRGNKMGEEYLEFFKK